MNPNPYFKDCLILIKGAGDLASGVAYRLKRSGFPLIMTELPAPLMVRRMVCFGNAVYSGQTTVEDIPARRVETIEAALALANSPTIPILVDPIAATPDLTKPAILVDAIMAKINTGTRLDQAPLVVALGPGFRAGHDCHAVIETMRGHWLGRVIYEGSAQANTGTPGPVKGHTADRVLRAPADGHVIAATEIGDSIKPGQLIGTVNGQEIRAPFAGVLRGLVHPQVAVTAGFKVGDLDPRADQRHCFTISDKSLTIGGGVLEAILASQLVRPAAMGQP
jgi:xanthine dehydrogenase accessory factor